MKLSFLGANRQVTGSRYCLAAGGKTVMIDCGMFQEREFLSRNWDPCPIPPEQIDALLLTHVHIDHCGLVPRLVQQGFSGPIITTRASADLLDIVWRDAAKIQAEDAEYKRRRHEKEGRRGKGKHDIVPLFTEQDVEEALSLLTPTPYDKPTPIGDNLSVEFLEAGHILGSAILRLVADHNGQKRQFVFSGDLGQRDKPLLRNPAYVEQADYVVMESTYGDRDHPTLVDAETQLADVICSTIGKGGKVVIPTFAIERAQELVYHIGRLVHEDRIPNVPVFLDSPMAVDVTGVFRKHRDCFDADAWQLIVAGEAPLKFPGLKLVRATADSIALNTFKRPAIVMATSGMCTAGRIKHHLKHNISRPESTILFVGYQGRGTLGRFILGGNSQVRIHGRQRPVRARIEQLHGLSGHADRKALLDWLDHIAPPPRTLFLTHGEEESALALADQVRQRAGWNVEVPEYGQEVELD